MTTRSSGCFDPRKSAPTNRRQRRDAAERRTRRSSLIATPIGLFALLIQVNVAASDETLDRDALDRRLARAERVEVTAHWRKSQAVLDKLRPHLELADNAQYARFRTLEIRNLGLAGEVDAALEATDRLLETDMPRAMRLHALALGANIAERSRRHAEAFRYLNRALEMLDGESPIEPGIYALAATLYAGAGQRQRAIEYGELALQQARRLGPRQECIARLCLGRVYREFEQLAAARRHNLRATSVCGEAGGGRLRHAVDYRRADLLRVAGRNDRARGLFERALKGLRETGDRVGLNEARLYFARLEAESGRPERVEALLMPAIGDLERDENWEHLAEAHRLLAEAARNRGEPAQALERYERHMAARGRRERALRARQTAFVEARFDLLHTRQQLQRLRERASARFRFDGLRLGLFTLLAGLVAALVLLLRRATRERRRFQSLSQRDALTALSNHTRFFELAERTLSLARQKGLPFTLVLADIDHFKQVNDHYGHQAGDEVIRRVAVRLREQFGRHGIIGRIGGEEFGIALPGMGIARAEEQLQVLRRALAESRRDDPPVNVTMSFGVARPRDHESLSEIRARADQGLYEAKHAGRDRVVVVDGGG